MDTVVSGQGKTTACFITLIERKTRYYIAVKSPDRKAETVAALVIKTLSALPKGAVKTITADNGNEFALWENMERALDCEIYFTDTYCSWQKGSNENANGLLREFYPKGRNLSHVNSKTLEKVTLPLSGRFFIFGHSPSLLDRVLSTHGTTCQSLRFLLATRERVLRVVYT